MDRVTQRRKKGNRLLGQRYLLQAELVSNSAGTLHQARDMRAGSSEKAAVLIHILPTNALPQIPLKLMTERLQALSAQTDAAVLKVLDSGWLNPEPYFVLESPPSWSFSSLPPMLGQSTRLHEQALRLNQHLTEQGLLTTALPTSLFLVSVDGSVYLPSTALAPSLASFTESPELLLQAHLLPKRSHFSTLPWLGLGVIGVVAASGAGWYYQNYLMTSQAILQVRTEAANTTSLFEAAANLDLPLTTAPTSTTSLADNPELRAPKAEVAEAQRKQAVTASTPPTTTVIATQPDTPRPIDLALTDTHILSDPEPGDRRLAFASEQNKPQALPKTRQPVSNSTKPMHHDKHTPSTTTSTKPIQTNKPKPEKKPTPKQPEAQAEFAEETDPSVNLPSPQTQLIRASVDTLVPRAQFADTNLTPNALAVIPAPQPAQVATTAPILGVVNPVVTAPVVRRLQPSTVVTERDPEALSANGMTSDELVKKAYQALQANRLDEQANRGAVYFTRLLDRIDHGNPQILRLAREISYQLHQQVRTALIQGDSEQASQKLWRAGRIIKEFNLVHLNPAQEILEHKLVE